MNALKRFGGWLKTANWPIYPILIALYPVVFLYSGNFSLVPEDEFFQALAAAAILAIVTFVVCWGITRNPHRGAVIASLALIFFFAIGHIMNVTGDFARIVLPLGAVITLALIVLAWWKLPPESARKAASSLNLVTAVLLAFPSIPVWQVLSAQSADVAPPPAPAPLSLAKAMNDAQHPDIYYIILDAYPANKQLMRDWGYDNSAFTDALEERGFYVAYDATSNYGTTLPSMGSSLNMRYLIEGEQPQSDRSGNAYARALVADNEVARQLQGRGYTYVFMMSGWDRPSTIADVNIDIYKEGARRFKQGELKTDDRLTKQSFWRFLLETTAMRDTTLADTFDPPAADAGKPLWFQTPNRALHTWATAEEIPDMPEATFTIVHIIKPHTPIGFDRDGNPIKPPPDDQLEEYFFPQLEFVNERTLQMIDAILSKSTVPPIIIIQGDHGSNLGVPENPDGHKVYFEVLDAYHFPNGGEASLYQSISAVNSFRVMFNTYFGGSYALLSDEHHFEVPDDYNNLFHFVERPLPEEQ